MDEDGVLAHEEMTHKLGAIAMQGGFVFEELAAVCVKLPRRMGPVSSPASRFDESARAMQPVRSTRDL